jgi:uncharacterized protein YcfJ
MKNYRFLTIVFLGLSILLGGCATSGQMGRDAMSVMDKPVTAAVIGAVAGGIVDKHVFNGNGKVGAIVGGTVGYAIGDKRQDRQRTFMEAQTNCRVSQTGYYEGPNSFVVTSERRVCDAQVSNRGFRAYPDSNNTNNDVAVRYDLRGSAQTSSSGPSSRSCTRYTSEGVNTSC